MKIIGISGTNSSDSPTEKLVNFMAQHFANQVEFEVIELKGLPMFNESNDLSNQEPLKSLVAKIEAADGVVIATSEHNRSIPSALNSFLEWMSFTVHPFDEKPVMVVGTSVTRQGSASAQLHLRQVLDAPGVNALVLPGNEFLLGQAAEAFDENGAIKEANTVDFLESCFANFLRFIKAADSLQIPDEVRFEPGDYQVKTKGHNGDLPMVVSFSENRIEDIKVDTSGETEGIADTVFERLPQEIIAGQTLNVDAVSGASVTSYGLIDGVAQAVKLAGVDPNILKKRPKPSKSQDLSPLEYETDVVVVGGGGAGLAAASRVLQAGKSTIVLEKFPALGGNTVRAGGPMNAADPDWQKQFAALPGEASVLKEMLDYDLAKIDPEYQADFKALQGQIKDYLAGKADYLFDSILWHRIQTYLGGKRVDLNGNEIHGDYDLVKVLTDHALESVKWLADLGVEFDESQVTMPVGAKWRRGHKPMESQGFAFIKTLKKFIEEHEAGQILTETPVKRFLLDEQGQICGVVALNAANRQVIVKAKAVILASGGFGANTKMVQKYNTYWSQVDDDIATSNSPAITGDGIKLGQSVGAALVGMGFTQMMPVSDPKTGELFSGLQVPPANYVMVNQQGKRFVDEYEGRDVLTKAAFDNGGLFYLIADDEIKKTAYNTTQASLDAQVEAGTLFRADTLADLAKQIKVDPQTFEETIAKYNSYVDAGVDPEFGKEVFDLKVVKPPFYATPRKPAIHHTMGGLKINTKAQVINEAGQVIPNLYAAGEVAGGIHAGNRLGGNSLTDIFTYGRIAAKTALEKM